jgi:hypothetical protein
MLCVEPITKSLKEKIQIEHVGFLYALCLLVQNATQKWISNVFYVKCQYPGVI